MPRDIKTLRVIILGGEACPPAVASRWCRPGRTIFNSYGPTEATVVATVAEVRPDEPVTIGGPIANYTCYVADEANNLLERGVEGELLIGGPGVAARLSQARFPHRREIHPQSVRFHRDGPDPLSLWRRRGAGGRRQDRLPRPHRRPGQDPRLPRGAGRDRGQAFRPAGRQPGGGGAAQRRRPRPARRLPRRRKRASTLDPKSPARRTARRAAALYGPVALRDARGAAAPVLGQGQPQRPEEGAADGADDRRGAGGAADRNRARPARGRAKSPAAAVHSLRRRFLHSISAAIRCSPRASSSVVRQTPALAGVTLQDMYSARTLRAIAALLDAKAAETGGPKDLSFTPPPLLRRFLCGLAQAICLPFFIAHGDGAMAGHFRFLHAADGYRRQLLAGSRFAARRLCLRQHRHRHSRHRAEMAGDRQVQAGALPDLGRLLFPLVGGAAHAHAHPYQMVPGLAPDARLSPGARARKSARTPIFPNWKSAPSIS